MPATIDLQPELILNAYDEDEIAYHRFLRDDPIAFCRHALGFVPHKGQESLLTDDLRKQYTLIVGSRQTGKTYGTAAKVAYDLFACSSIRIFVYNPSESQSDVLFDYVIRFYKSSPYLSRYCKIKLQGKKLFVGNDPDPAVLEVVKVGIDGKRARGRSVEGNGYVIGDESASHLDGWTVAEACEAFSATNPDGGGILYLSSPADPNDSNFFYSTYCDWQEQQRIAETEGRHPRHKVYTFRASDTHHISADFLAEQKRRYESAGRLWVYQREYESEWVAPIGAFFDSKDVNQCVETDLPHGDRLSTYVWAMDPGARKSPAVIMVGRFNQAFSRIEVIDVRSFIFADKYKSGDGHESITEYEELVHVCCDLRRRYSPAWFGVDPNTEKSLSERLANTFRFPIKDICIGSYPAKMTFLRDLQRALAERKVVWNDRRLTEQLLSFAPPKNERTGRYEFPDHDYDLIVCLGMLVRYLGQRDVKPFCCISGGKCSW